MKGPKIVDKGSTTSFTRTPHNALHQARSTLLPGPLNQPSCQARSTLLPSPLNPPAWPAQPSIHNGSQPLETTHNCKQKKWPQFPPAQIFIMFCFVGFLVHPKPFIWWAPGKSELPPSPLSNTKKRNQLHDTRRLHQTLERSSAASHRNHVATCCGGHCRKTPSRSTDAHTNRWQCWCMHCFLQNTNVVV